MYVAPSDRSLGEAEWRPWVESQSWGHLVVPGDRSGWPAIVPTQFVLDGDTVLCHLVAANPALAAMEADPRAVMSVAGDWASIPSDWKAIDDEDPALGIPTTYYAAVQLRGRAEVVSTPDDLAAILRHQLGATQAGTPVADPGDAHAAKLRGIRGVVLHVEEVAAKFKYGGNVDAAHRLAVASHLDDRQGPGDSAAAAHLRRRLGSEH